MLIVSFRKTKGHTTQIIEVKRISYTKATGRFTFFDIDDNVVLSDNLCFVNVKPINNKPGT
jgi:hypothetical protein